MAPHSKLLICEHVVAPSYRAAHGAEEGAYTAPEPLLPNWGAGFTSRLDLQVLAVINAKQRSEADFETLVHGTGLKVARFWRNMGDEVIIECRLS